VAWLRRTLDELRATRLYFYGDFYPLLSYSLADDVWCAWQWDRPDLGGGPGGGLSPAEQSLPAHAGLLA